MSVLVPWLTMPDSCITCPLEERCPTLKAEDNAWDYADKRCEKCELIENPKRGEWIPIDSYTACGGDEATWEAHGNPIAYWYCSECKEQNYVDEFGMDLLTKFCPHCGADLRGDSDE